MASFSEPGPVFHCLQCAEAIGSSLLSQPYTCIPPEIHSAGWLNYVPENEAALQPCTSQVKQASFTFPFLSKAIPTDHGHAVTGTVRVWGLAAVSISISLT